MPDHIARIVISMFFLIIFGNSVFSQIYERKISEFVRMISEGESERVAVKISELKKKIPRAAGIIYIEGLVASNGNESMQCFKIIADSFPHSDWADDALARLFEYNQSIGEYSDAEESYNRLKSGYPKSPYITTDYLHQVRLSDTGRQDDQGKEYAVQIGAFSVKENAEKLKRRLIEQGYKVDIYENLLDGKNLLYLVWVGSYITYEDAQLLKIKIKSKFDIDGVLRMRSSWKKW